MIGVPGKCRVQPCPLEGPKIGGLPRRQRGASSASVSVDPNRILYSCAKMEEKVAVDGSRRQCGGLKGEA